MDATSAPIPVLKPRLPQADRLLPYLKRVDANRWYANFGPLAKEFEHRLAALFGVEDECLVTAANGTLALTLALEAQGARRGGYCLMPSWTFTATPAAALQAGLEPYFLDVDPATQALSPEAVREAIADTGGRVTAVIAVAPFGMPLDTLAWDALARETGVAVVIDAAAGFDALAGGVMRAGESPVMVSLHATKTLGIGEGGLLVSRNPQGMAAARRKSNFGFREDRRSLVPGMNAKLSEYAAAVGLAALDGWPQTRKDWVSVHEAYRGGLQRLGISPFDRPDVVTATMNVLLPGWAPAAAEKLAALGVETRAWWGSGCHAHPAYAALPREKHLPATEQLAQSVLGLPMAVDMDAELIGLVCRHLEKICVEMREAA